MDVARMRETPIITFMNKLDRDIREIEGAHYTCSDNLFE